MVSSNQFARRFALDPDVPEAVKPYVGLIFGMVRHYYSDSQRLKMFSPAIDYDDLVQEMALLLVTKVAEKYDEALCDTFIGFAHVMLGRRLGRLAENDRRERGPGMGYRTVSPGTEIADDEALVPTIFEQVESLLTARDFAYSLTQRQRDIFVLRYEDSGISMRDIAEKLGISPATVMREVHVIQEKYTAYEMVAHLPAAAWEG